MRPARTRLKHATPSPDLERSHPGAVGAGAAPSTSGGTATHRPHRNQTQEPKLGIPCTARAPVPRRLIIGLPAGHLKDASGAATTDIVDTCVVEGALRRHDLVLGSDEADLQAIAAAISRRLEVDRP